MDKKEKMDKTKTLILVMVLCIVLYVGTLIEIQHPEVHHFIYDYLSMYLVWSVSTDFYHWLRK